jgi:hypothetical protein
MSTQIEHEHDEGDEVEPVTVPHEPTDEEAAEHEEHDHEHGQAEPEPEASGPQSDKEVRALGKQLDEERDRHASRLGVLLGDASTDTLPCPLCFEGLMGFVLPNDALSLSDEEREAALAFLGSTGARKLRPAKGVRECDACGGEGVLEFPTKVPHVKEQTCPACTGAGYVLDQPTATSGGSVITFAPQTAAQPAPVADACPLCGQAGMNGQPHWCIPQASASAVT